MSAGSNPERYPQLVGRGNATVVVAPLLSVAEMTWSSLNRALGPVPAQLLPAPFTSVTTTGASSAFVYVTCALTTPLSSVIVASHAENAVGLETHRPETPLMAGGEFGGACRVTCTTTEIGCPSGQKTCTNPEYVPGATGSASVT